MKSKVLSKTQKALSDLSQIFLLISPSAIPSPHRLDLGHSRFFSPLYLNKKSLYLAQGLCPSCLPYLGYPSLSSSCDSLFLRTDGSVQCSLLSEVFSNPAFLPSSTQPASWFILFSEHYPCLKSPHSPVCLFCLLLVFFHPTMCFMRAGTLAFLVIAAIQSLEQCLSFSIQ